MAIRDRVDGGSRADAAMEAYASGDDSGFPVLYDELAPRLFRFALRRLGSRAASEDVVQQTLLQIHTARHRFVRGAAVLPWAYAIARRLVIDTGRRRSHEEQLAASLPGTDEPSSAPSPEEALHRKWTEEALRRDLASLPASLRESFELVRVEGLSVAEAAEVLGITRGMVKVRAHRAGVQLRDAQARREQEPAETTSDTPPPTTEGEAPA